jgi:hypothetical protein
MIRNYQYKSTSISLSKSSLVAAATPPVLPPMMKYFCIVFSVLVRMQQIGSDPHIKVYNGGWRRPLQSMSFCTGLCYLQSPQKRNVTRCCPAAGIVSGRRLKSQLISKQAIGKYWWGGGVLGKDCIVHTRMKHSHEMTNTAPVLHYLPYSRRRQSHPSRRQQRPTSIAKSSNWSMKRVSSSTTSALDISRAFTDTYPSVHAHIFTGTSLR